MMKLSEFTINIRGSALIFAFSQQLKSVLFISFSFTSFRLKETIYSKKYGVDLVRFVPNHTSNVICASKNSWDHTLRLLSLSDNQYLRYFKGHRDR